VWISVVLATRIPFFSSLLARLDSVTVASFTKFVRPQTPTPGLTTDRDLDIIEAVLRYRFSPTSQLVRLVGGNEDVTLRRLRRLWEKGLVNR